MSTTAFRFSCPLEAQDELVAWLDHAAVTGFLQEDDHLTVYAASSDAPVVRDLLVSARPGLLAGEINEESIADRNWNAEWEKTIQPILAGPFRVLPTWNESASLEGIRDILIDPKMSFGTGHHESTRLLLAAMPERVSEGDHVLDAGTGTGVLALAALMLGAQHADAFDNDPICIENASENAELNGMDSRFHVFLNDGSELGQHVQTSRYDVITANINREVLRWMVPLLAGRLKQGGCIGLAGLLVSDGPLMRSEIQGWEMQIIHESEEGAWWSVWIEPAATG
ncbi:MAG: 50S ribosomal protein L11 methyltransferase [Rhodothermales bacterium]